MKKTIAWLLLVLILGLPHLLWPKIRYGAEVIVFRKDGSSIRGELIAVKKTSLLLPDFPKRP